MPWTLDPGPWTLDQDPPLRDKCYTSWLAPGNFTVASWVSLYRSNAGARDGMISPSSDVRVLTSVVVVVSCDAGGIVFWFRPGQPGQQSGNSTGNDITNLVKPC